MSTVSKANTRSLEAVEVFLITEILTLLWVFLVPSNAIAFLSDTEHRNTIFSEQSQRLITLEGKFFAIDCLRILAWKTTKSD